MHTTCLKESITEVIGCYSYSFIFIVEIQHKELRLTLLNKIIYDLVEHSLLDYIIPAP